MDSSKILSDASEYPINDVIKSFLENPKPRKVVILIDDEAEALDYAKWSKNAPKEAVLTVVALSPFAMYELDRQGIGYRLIDDYCTQKETYDIGINNGKLVEELCDHVDKRLRNACPDLEKYNIRPALFNVIGLRILFDVLAIRTAQLSGLITAEKPDGIIIYKKTTYGSESAENLYVLSFDDNESVYEQLLTLKGWNTEILTLPAPAGPQHAEGVERSGTYKRGLLKWLRNRPYLFSLIKTIKKRGIGELSKRIREGLFPKRIPVVFFREPYNWDDSLGELSAAGIGPVIRMSDRLDYWQSKRNYNKEYPFALKHAWDELKTDTEFRNYFIFFGIDFFPILEARLKILVEDQSLACINAYKEAERIFHDKGIKILVAPQFFTSTGRSVSQSARNNKIPVVTWQHGGYGSAYQLLMKYYELMSSDYHFVFGIGVAERHSEDAKLFGTKIIEVGSTSLDVLSEKIASLEAKTSKQEGKKKVVLYVTSSICANLSAVFFYPLFSDNYFWITERSILDTLGRHDEYRVIVKIHPSRHKDPHMIDYAKDRGYTNIEYIKDECSFEELIPAADMIVSDLPSTTLLQALTTTKPLFVYTGHYRMDAVPLRMLNKRAFVSDSLDKFCSIIDDYLSGSRGNEDIDQNNKEFLKAYGISSQGRGAGKRAATALKQLTEGQSNK